MYFSLCYKSKEYEFNFVWCKQLLDILDGCSTLLVLYQALISLVNDNSSQPYFLCRVSWNWYSWKAILRACTKLSTHKNLHLFFVKMNVCVCVMDTAERNGQGDTKCKSWTILLELLLALIPLEKLWIQLFFLHLCYVSIQFKVRFDIWLTFLTHMWWKLA